MATPLVIPSFSSKGHPLRADGVSQLNDDVEFVVPTLTNAVLLSAYDMHHGQLPGVERLQDYPPRDPYHGPRVIFIDSGGYESQPRVDVSGVVNFPWEPAAWSRELLEGVLTTLHPRLTAVMVSFDSPDEPIASQIAAAAELHDRHPTFAIDCLLKARPGLFLDINEIADAVGDLAGLDVIGVTEAELGPNLRGRLDLIHQLRATLDATEIAAPIHVFGSLDPVVSTMYLLAGADIFDGLTWLRYALTDIPMHPDTYAAVSMPWTFDGSEQRAVMLRRNTQVLADLEARMRRYRRGGDPRDLGLDDVLLSGLESVTGWKGGS